MKVEETSSTPAIKNAFLRKEFNKISTLRKGYEESAYSKPRIIITYFE